jgi:hypothetical protein
MVGRWPLARQHRIIASVLNRAFHEGLLQGVAGRITPRVRL